MSNPLPGDITPEDIEPDIVYDEERPAIPEDEVLDDSHLVPDEERPAVLDTDPADVPPVLDDEPEDI